MATLLFHGSQLYQNRIKATINTKAKLRPLQHAKMEALIDRYGQFNLPTTIPNRYEVVELEQVNGNNTKYVLRWEYDADKDIVVVLRPCSGGYVIITAWINEATDNHKTLNTKRYNLPNLVKY